MTAAARGRSSLWQLYCAEVESHAKALTEGLLALEQDLTNLERTRGPMRAAHSIKGAARVVHHDLAVEVAHAMEDRLVAAQQGRQPLSSAALQRLLDGVDLLTHLSPEDEADRDARVAERRADAERLVADLTGQTSPTPAAPEEVVPPSATAALPSSRTERPDQPGPAASKQIRLSAQTVTRMLGLASEAVVGMRSVDPLAARMSALKQRLSNVTAGVERLGTVSGASISSDVSEGLSANRGLSLPEVASSAERAGVLQRLEEARAEVTEIMAGLESFALRQDTLAGRLYREVQATRMRPFAELAQPFPRLVRDLSRQLGKQVRLVVEGESTDVDRDVASLLESPLIHAVRNAIDHGIELPEVRVARGKPETGTLRLSAHHHSGLLVIDVVDDGRGVDLDDLRRRVIERKLADAELAARLSEQELLAFLFLPGFTTATRVTEVSGRGVGLDLIMEGVKEIGGALQLFNRPGHGLTLRFGLPVTLSVVRALIVEVAGQPYAVPLNRVERVEDVERTEIRSLEGRRYLSVAVSSPGRLSAAVASAEEVCHVGLVSARQILGLPAAPPTSNRVPILIVREHDTLYGLAVDRLVGDRMVVVRPLDARLGKVKDIAAAGLLSDGTPLLVVDVDDMLRSIDQTLKGGGRLERVGDEAAPAAASARRVLVVDDSITVRELERQILETHGYHVDVAVDGMDGWNGVRTGHYDVVVTDIDMPRMDGIELVRRIRADQRFVRLPVVVVSYKDREEDRLRGLEAGASYYLPKSSFSDDTFLQAVEALVGKARETA